MHINSIEEAIAYVNGNKYGNMACIFTSSGLHARRFRNEADAGNIGINIGVAAPVAQFPGVWHIRVRQVKRRTQ